jgi:prepilin-type N-terminal cleavage/methylation domain-containing protein
MIHHRHDKHGFSIVEVLLALAILTFGVFGIYEQFLKSNQRGLGQVSQIKARLLASQELEHLRACSYASLKSWKPTADSLPYPGNLKFQYLDTLAVRPDGLLELSVQVGWDMRSGEKFEPGHSITVKGVKAP